MVDNSLKALPGDTVSIVLESKRVIAGAVFIYLTPVLGLLGGALSGEFLAPALGTDPETASVVLGLTFLAAALLVVRIAGRRMGASGKFAPRMGRFVNRGTGGHGKCAISPDNP